MVQLVEVPDEHFEGAQPGPAGEEDEFVDTDSEISDDSDFDPRGESLTERLYALRDIVPPSARSWVSSRVGASYRLASSATWFSAKALWVLSTSAILVGVPWALAFAEEQNLVAMEQEYKMREMGGELLTAGAPATGEGSNTAEKVSAALGKEAKPAL